MKILIYGAGVLGCNLARNLFRAGKNRRYSTCTGKMGGGNQKERVTDKRQIFAPHIGQSYSGRDCTHTG